MAGNNKLELVVEVDANKRTPRFKSVNAVLISIERAASKAGYWPRTLDRFQRCLVLAACSD